MGPFLNRLRNRATDKSLLFILQYLPHFYWYKNEVKSLVQCSSICLWHWRTQCLRLNVIDMVFTIRNCFLSWLVVLEGCNTVAFATSCQVLLPVKWFVELDYRCSSGQLGGLHQKRCLLSSKLRGFLFLGSTNAPCSQQSYRWIGATQRSGTM